jgi:hypothetical protein
MVGEGAPVQNENKERWKLRCEQAAVEQDPAKLHELIREINRLLEEKQDQTERQFARGTVLGATVQDTPGMFGSVVS